MEASIEKKKAPETCCINHKGLHIMGQRFTVFALQADKMLRYIKSCSSHLQNESVR